MDNKDLEKLVVSVQRSAKYTQIDEGVIAQIGAAEMAKGRNLKEAIKATKAKLHQITGAYMDRKPKYTSWLENLAAAEDHKIVAREIMPFHASTREREPILSWFYRTIFKDFEPMGSVLDMACGFNPLTSMWMPLREDAKYICWDIDTELLDFVCRALTIIGYENRTDVVDLTTLNSPTPQVDLALLLKTIPVLEQVEKGIGPRLLDLIRAKYVLVSYPAKSLGGRKKGMPQNYEEQFMAMVDGKGWEVKKYEFETELAFLVDKQAKPAGASGIMF